MTKKQKIIFIIVFLLVGVIILGFYSWYQKRGQEGEGADTPWYQSFNPFSGINLGKDIGGGGEEFKETETERELEISSRFSQITDFAVAGAMFTEETKLVEGSDNQTQEEVVLDPKTKEGRIKIQELLNRKLFPSTPLIEDGNFGPRTTALIKEFQKANSLPETGTLDKDTLPLFTETRTITPLAKYELVPTLRYVERMNGHLHKIFLKTGVSEKISNSTIPSIYEAFFDKKGETVIYRYLSTDKTISSFLATLGSSKGEYLPSNITDFSTSLDKSKFFYLTRNTSGAIGTLGDFSSSFKSVVFNSPFTEWLSDWDSNQNIYLTSKASYAAEGSIFRLNTTTKTLSKLFGGVLGLTTKINRSGTLVLYSTSTNSGPTLSVFKNKDYSFKNLDTYGLPEKCVWDYDNISVYCAIPNIIYNGKYPDSWYQGTVSFEDYFVKINTETGEKVTYANSNEETPVDAVSLFLDKDGKNLFFINKKDYTLWSFNLN